MRPSLATQDRTDAGLRRAAQLAPLGQGLPVNESVRPRGQSAGVGEKKVNTLEHGPWPFILPRYQAAIACRSKLHDAIIRKV